VENDYNRQLQSYIDKWVDAAKRILLPNIQSLIDQRNLEVPAGSRSDDWADDADRLMESMKQSGVSFQFDAGLTAKDIGDKTNAWNDAQWRKIVRSTFGVDMFQREPWLNAELNSFTKENVKLISKMTSGMLDDIDTTVQRGIKSGSSYSTMAKDIEGRFGVTRSRAKLIARDQVSKLNGNLTQLRQTEAGVDSYIWVDSDDSRVRPSHSANDGKIFKWTEPPSTGHPGSAIQCRCYGDPVFDDIMAEVTGAEVISSPAIKATEVAARKPRKVRFKEMSDAEKKVLDQESSDFFNRDADKEKYAAFNTYVGPGYANINKYLRKDFKKMKGDWKAWVPDTVKTMQDAYTTKYPAYKGTSWRGVKFETTWEFNSFIETIEKNKSKGISFPEFISSSQDERVIKKFTGQPHRSVVFEIRGKNGMNIGKEFDTGREREVLFKPGSKFKITSWDSKLDYADTHIVLEEI